MDSPLTAADTGVLRAIVSRTTAPLVVIAEDFCSKFTPVQQFRACLQLVLTLCTGHTHAAADTGNRLASLVVLADFRQSSNKPKLVNNPFLACFLSLLGTLDDAVRPRTPCAHTDIDHRMIERQMVVRLLTDEFSAQMMLVSPQSIIDSFKYDKYCYESSLSSSGSELARRLEPLRAIVNQCQPPAQPSLSLPMSQSQSQPATLLPPRTPVAQSPVPAKQAQTPSTDTKSPSSLSFQSLTPSSSLSQSSSLTYESLIEMLAKAQKSSFNNNDRALVTGMLTGNDSLCLALVEHGLIASQWSMIVEKNPSLASPIIESLLSCHSHHSLEFLSSLSKIELSLHSMEVVNRLTSSIAASPSPPFTLPPDFLPSYIVHAIDRCKSLKDKYLQTRLVRLVCVFLQSLLRLGRHATIDRDAGLALNDLYQEIAAFCAEFSKVKEAAQLFAAIKEAEQLQVQHQQAHSVNRHSSAASMVTLAT